MKSILPFLVFQAVAGTLSAQAAPAEFDAYWNRGEAEIARYALTQNRYGELRNGHAVLLFVTEDFRRDTQVKDESGAEPSQSVRILKLNRIQRFATGIYDYSLMLSVFSPVDRAVEPRTLKTTASVQDWCGHVWMQLNAEGDDEYRLTGHSYFEGEGEGEENRSLGCERGVARGRTVHPRAHGPEPVASRRHEADPGEFRCTTQALPT